MMESAIILISGTAVGVIAGMFGVGGSFLLVPLLSIATSVPIQFLVGSCTSQVLGPATAALLSFRIRRRDLRIPVILMGGIVMGTLAGSEFLSQMQQRLGEDSQAMTAAIQYSYIALLWILGLFSLWEARLHRQGKPLAIGWLKFSKLKPTCEVFGRDRKQKISVISLSLFGLFVGFLAGFLGLSGGIILFPGLHYAYGIPSKRSAIMSLILVWMIAFQATLIHAAHGRVDLYVVALLLVGSTFGAKFGVYLSLRTTGGKLREHFAGLLLGTASAITIYLLLPGR